jgi:predicted TIM-barrel fold metal-dependent hydrolase
MRGILWGKGSAMAAARQSAYPGRMAEIVNLNRHRKQAARAQQERQAEANRVKFGRDRPARLREAEEETRRRALLDGARLDGNPPDPG